MTDGIPDAPGDALAAFGRWLTRERELRALGREEVARITRLAPGVVEALESGEEGRMPPRAYVVGYLRSYAAALGLDPDEVVLRYEEAAATPSDGAAPRPADGRRIALAVAVGAAVAAAGVAWALLRR